MFLGTALAYAGRPEEAVPLLEKAMRLNPLSQEHASMVLFRLGIVYSIMGRYEKAVSDSNRKAGCHQADTRNLPFPEA
jgi:tetratricopeptide (TPR) repeat protein